MSWKIFLLCLTSIVTPAIAASQQEPKTKPLTSKETKLKSGVDLPKTFVQKKAQVISADPHLPSPGTTQSNSNIYYKDYQKPLTANGHNHPGVYYSQDKTTLSAQEINKKAINDLTDSRRQTSEGLNQKHYNSNIVILAKQPR